MQERAFADPCPVCFSESQPHACPVSLAQPVTIAITHTNAGTFYCAFYCAFTRAIRDA